MEQKNIKRPNFRLGFTVLGLSLLLLAVDQLTKYYVQLYLKPDGTIEVIRGLLEITYLENRGAAFGMFKGQIALVVIFTLAAFGVMLYWLFFYTQHTFLSLSTLTLLFAGGAGNLIDRYLYGYVIDFIHVLFFPYIFNFADCCITVGAAFMILFVLRSGKGEKKEQHPEEPT